MNEIKRTDIKTGMLVKIVTKEDQRTGELTAGIVKAFSPALPAGRQNLETSERNKSKTCPKDSFGEISEVGSVRIKSFSELFPYEIVLHNNVLSSGLTPETVNLLFSLIVN